MRWLRSLFCTQVEKPIIVNEDEKQIKGIYCPHCSLKIYRVTLGDNCTYCSKRAIVWNPVVDSYIIERRHDSNSSD